MRRDRLEAALSVLLTAAALVIAAAVARREFFGRRSVGGAAVRLEPPKYYAEWRPMLGYGVQVGDSAARAHIIEFLDLECPACRHYNRQVLDSVRRLFGRDLSVTFIHFPLSFHRFARISARASECAAAQGKFAEFVETVYRSQDSLGLKSWGSFAADAQVTDTLQFVACVSATTPVPRVDSGVSLAERLEVTATPTIFVNGWRFEQPPSAGTLSSVIRDLLAGSEPDWEQVAQGESNSGR
jgi:protein-disulfide isomerase